MVAEPAVEAPVRLRGRKARQIFVDHNGAPMGCNLDLIAACAWKGVKYTTVVAEPLYQPMLGFTRISLGRGARHATRYFPRAEVELWNAVFEGELPGYVMALIERDDAELTRHIFLALAKADKRGRLPHGLRHVYSDLHERFLGAA